MIGIHWLTVGQLLLFTFALAALLAFLALGCRFFLRVTPPKAKRRGARARGGPAQCAACGAALKPGAAQRQQVSAPGPGAQP